MTTFNEYSKYDLSQPHILTWREWRSMFWFLLLSKRKIKIAVITDFGMGEKNDHVQ